MSNSKPERKKGYWSTKVKATPTPPESPRDDFSSSSEDEESTEPKTLGMAVRVERGIAPNGNVWETRKTVFGDEFVKTIVTEPKVVQEFKDLLAKGEISPSYPDFVAEYQKQCEVPKKKEEPKEPHPGQLILPLPPISTWEFVLAPTSRDNENKPGPSASSSRKVKGDEKRCEKVPTIPIPRTRAELLKCLHKDKEDKPKKAELPLSPAENVAPEPNEEESVTEDEEEVPELGPDGEPLPPKPKTREQLLKPVKGLNPLLFDHVIEGVLRNLPTATIKACRFLCRQWNAAASVFLKDRGSFTLRNNPENEEEIEAIKRKLAENPDFGLYLLSVVGYKLLTFYTPAGLLMKQLCDKVCVLKMSACVVEPYGFNKFLKNHAKYLEILHLQSVGFDWKLSEYIGLAWVIVLDGLVLRNLKELKLVDEYDVDYEGVELYNPLHGPLRIPMHRLSTSFPNLKRLVCKGDIGFDNQEDVIHAKTYLNNDRHKDSNWNITLEEFVFHRSDSENKPLDPSIFVALQKIGTKKLRKVDITPFHDGEEPEKGHRWTMDPIYVFLEHIKEYVEEVRVAVYSGNCPVAALPLLPIQFLKLKRLCMSSDMIVSLSALPRIPSFTKLEIEDHHSSGGIQNLLNGGTRYDRFGDEISELCEPNGFITSLRLHTRGVIEIAKFGKYFPNVQELDLNFIFYDKQYVVPVGHKVDYKMLAKAFPLLEKLKIRTPIHYPSALDPNDDDLNGDTGIGSLEKLRELDIHPAGRITDAGLKNGLSKLSNLEFLNLSRSQITSASFQWLGQNRDKLPKLKTLKLEACSKITEEHCIELGQTIPDLNVIFSTRDSEIKWCFKRGQERKHDKETCNCDDAPPRRVLPNLNSCLGASGVRRMGAGFW